MKKNWASRVLNIALCIGLIMPGFVLAEEADPIQSDVILPAETAIVTMQEESTVDSEISQVVENAEETAVPDSKAEPDAVVIDQGTEVTTYLGQNLQLTHHFTPDNAEAETRWFSSNSKIATINYDGLLTPAKPGKVTVKVVSKNMKEGRISVNVVDPDVVTKVELDISGTKILSIGETYQLNASVYPETAQTTLKWGSSKKSIASVDQNGIVTAVKAGTVTVTVKAANGKKDTVKIQVVDPNTAAKVELNASGTVKLDIKDTLQLNAAITPATAQTALKWSSSSKTIATVDQNGLVTPKKTGTATITVKTANGKKDTVKVQVYDKTLPTGIKVEQGSKLTMAVGQKLELSALMKPETAISQLKWSTSNKKYATVSEDGIVTANKPGTVTISVKTQNGKKASTTIKIVKGVAPTEIKLNHSGIVPMVSGEKLQLNASLAPAEASSRVLWGTSDASIATVENGLVLAHNPGFVLITARTENNLYASCTISVKKSDKEFSYIIDNSEATITSYNFDEKSVVVPEKIDGYPVTKIAEKAFYYEEQLQSVSIPDSIEEIGDNAFEGCGELREIIIPEEAVLGKNAFKGCSKLTAHVAYGSKAHSYCVNNNIRYITYGDLVIIQPSAPTQQPNVTPTPTPTPTPVPNPVKYAFGDSADGKSTVIMGIMDDIMTEPVPDHLVIPEQLGGKPVTAIGENAFNGYEFSSVSLPDSVTSIGNGAFSRCFNLQTIELPEGITAISEDMFYKCVRLKQVKLGQNVVAIGKNAFAYCSQLESIDIPDSVVAIGSNAFDSCENLKRITIPGSVNSIGGNAFIASGLEEVVVEEGVSFIGSNAFRSCPSLTSVTLPESVEMIGKKAFEDCNANLKVLVIENSYAHGYCKENNINYEFYVRIEEPSEEDFVWDFDKDTAKVVILEYKGNAANIIIPAEIDGMPVTEIAAKAFQNSEVQNVVIPDTVTTIGTSAFIGAKQLQRITIPDSVTSIGIAAFAESGLVEIRLPAKLTVVPDELFFACGSLKKVMIPAGVTKIGTMAFNECTSLTAMEYYTNN